MPKYQTILAEMSRSGKICKVGDTDVNAEQQKLEDTPLHGKCNDPHIIAIVIVSKCCLVCTKDGALIKFLKDKTFYPKDVKIPRIYQREEHKNLLVDANIAPICKRSSA